MDAWQKACAEGPCGKPAQSAPSDADPATADHRDHRAAGDDEGQSRRDDVGCLESGPRQIPAVLRPVRVGTGAVRIGTCTVRRTAVGRAVRRTTAGIGRTVRAIGGAVTACRTVAAVRGTAIGSTAVGTTVITGGGIGVL